MTFHISLWWEEPSKWLSFWNKTETRCFYESHTSKKYVFANHKLPTSQPHRHLTSRYSISREHGWQRVSPSVCLTLSFLVLYSSPEEIHNAIWESLFLLASNVKSTLKAIYLFLVYWLKSYMQLANYHQLIGVCFIIMTLQFSRSFCILPYIISSCLSSFIFSLLCVHQPRKKHGQMAKCQNQEFRAKF